MGVSPSVLSDSCNGLRDRLGGVRRYNTSVVRMSIVSKRFIPGVALNTPVMGYVEGTAGLAFSIRLVVDSPCGCIPSFTGTNSSVVAFRARSSSSARGAVSRVLSLNGGTKLSMGPKAPVRTVCPCLSGLSLILVVAIRPNFNNRDFVRSVVPGIATIGGRVRHHKLGSVSVRISNKVGGSAVSITTGTNTGTFISKDTLFNDSSVGGAVTSFGESTAVWGHNLWTFYTQGNALLYQRAPSPNCQVH